MTNILGQMTNYTLCTQLISLPKSKYIRKVGDGLRHQLQPPRHTTGCFSRHDKPLLPQWLQSITCQNWNSSRRASDNVHSVSDKFIHH